MFDENRIILHTSDTIFLIDIKDILYCRSDNSYTTFFLLNQEPVIVSRNIKDFENQLASCGFIRPHQSYLVNLSHLRKIDKTSGFTLILTGNRQIPTSSRKKKEILKILLKESRFQTEI